MIIKRFQAKTEQEAVENAKKELGSGVVIMNVKNVKKKGLFAFLKKNMVEVTVALEEENERTPIPVKSVTTPSKMDMKAAGDAQKPEVNAQGASVKNEDTVPIPLTALEQLARVQEQNIKEQRMREEAAKSASTNVLNNEKAGVLEEKLDNLENLLKQQLDVNETSKDGKSEVTEEDSEQMKFVKLLYNAMIDNEVDERYANQIIEEVEKGAGQNMALDYFLSNVYQKMILKFGKPKRIEPADKGPKVVFFVGPTGVGKTTTIAKIASKFCVEEKKKVALLTADTYRIAAAEQLRTYANILEVPFRIVYSAPEMEQYYREFSKFDYILVYTAGHSHLNEDQRINSNVIPLSGKQRAAVEVTL